MAFGFWGSLQTFLQKVDTVNFSQQLSASRISSGGNSLSEIEEHVWKNDGIILKNLFSSLDVAYLNSLYVACEYDIPGHLGRVDLLIAGIFNNKISVLVIELKSWKNFTINYETNQVLVNCDNTINPLVQVEHYKNRLEIFHEYSNLINFIPLVLMTEAEEKQTNNLKYINNEINIFSVKDNKDDIIKFLYNNFSSDLNSHHINIVKEFIYGKCKPSIRWVQYLHNRLPNITAGINNALSNNRYIDLSPQQNSIVQSILYYCSTNQKTLILIHGSPGSGKTVIGLHAIIGQMINCSINQEKYISKRSVFALRNNRLCTVVRSALDDALKPGWGKSLVQYVKGGAQGIGIYYEVAEALNKNIPLPLYDLIVIDEAHRIPNEPNLDLSQLKAILHAGNTVVCLVDEGQSLNPDDNGNISTLKNVWHRTYTNSKIIEFHLNEQYRLPLEYSKWLSCFLSGNKEPFNNNSEYEINVASSPIDVINFLKNKSTNGYSCGILASYTKCNGRKGNDLRVPELGIRWLMNTSDYNIWWRESKIRHKFDKCSSVYGCQGFELDYVGLFWGNDLCFNLNNNKIVFFICPQNDITDDIGQAFGKKFRIRIREALNKYDEDLINQAILDLKNRYRILLSRGKKGIIIYFENSSSRENFLKILN